jgi:hypothetical protein
MSVIVISGQVQASQLEFYPKIGDHQPGRRAPPCGAPRATLINPSYTTPGDTNLSLVRIQDLGTEMHLVLDQRMSWEKAIQILQVLKVHTDR